MKPAEPFSDRDIGAIDDSECAHAENKAASIPPRFAQFHLARPVNASLPLPAFRRSACCRCARCRNAANIEWNSEIRRRPPPSLHPPRLIPASPAGHLKSAAARMPPGSRADLPALPSHSVPDEKWCFRSAPAVLSSAGAIVKTGMILTASPTAEGRDCLVCRTVPGPLKGIFDKEAPDETPHCPLQFACIHRSFARRCCRGIPGPTWYGKIQI